MTMMMRSQPLFLSCPQLAIPPAELGHSIACHGDNPDLDGDDDDVDDEDDDEIVLEVETLCTNLCLPLL